MPADCSVLRTPTILSNIRISWDIHPTFMLISGGPQGLSPTYEQAHVGLDLLTLASFYNRTTYLQGPLRAASFAGAMELRDSIFFRRLIQPVFIRDISGCRNTRKNL